MLRGRPSHGLGAWAWRAGGLVAQPHGRRGFGGGEGIHVEAGGRLVVAALGEERGGQGVR